MKIKYLKTEYLKIHSIKLIWKDSSIPLVKFKKDNDFWTAEVELPEGQYLYRLFINENILLNDPQANMYFPDEDNVLWLMLMINSEEERIYNNKNYAVNIKEYIITDNIYKESLPQNKKVFIPPADKMVATRFIFQNVTGLHTVSVLWITPDNEIFDICEDNLFSNNTPDNTTIWFYLNLHKNGVSYPLGTWKFQLFIDGDFVLEDKFEIKPQPAFLNQA